MSVEAGTIAARLKQRGKELGFSLIGMTAAARPETLDYFRDWLRQGYYGSMEYLPRRESAYEHPRGVQVGVRSIIVAAMNYGPGSSSRKTSPDAGRIAAYAQGLHDYHDILRDRLRQLGDELRRWIPEARTRIAVDTAPLLERDLARRAGLGWFGKNTMLINKNMGSYFFLGGILTDAELPADPVHAASHCGTCTRCLDACPTDAFVAPYVLDARRCLSHLTIEMSRDPIPEPLREGVGNWLFGCDVCQEVCPWNRKASPTVELAFQPRDQELPLAEELLEMGEEEFRKRFSQTPFSRPGRVAMARNAAIVLGNSGSQKHLPALQRAAQSSETLIADAARWAIKRLTGSDFPPTETAPSSQ